MGSWKYSHWTESFNEALGFLPVAIKALGNQQDAVIIARVACALHATYHRGRGAANSDAHWATLGPL